MDSNDNVYSFSVKNSAGEDVSLKIYEGKVLLIVNVASKCGFTPQYKGLQDLYLKYKDKGLQVLGFPCNQFGGQEPGTDGEIQSFCSLNYGVTFPIFQKIDVNGENASPLFRYLKKNAPGLLGSEAIKWNFTKFITGKDGLVKDRFAPSTTPEKLEEDIVTKFLREEQPHKQ